MTLLVEPTPGTRTVAGRGMSPSAGTGPREDEGQLRSVSIAVSVLDCFASRAELGPTEVSRQLGVAKSTASRMLSALATGGLLEATGGGHYRLGLRMFELGQLAVDRLVLREVGMPLLAELRECLRESVQLGVPMGGDVLYVDRLEVNATGLRLHLGTYHRGPGHSSSTGKILAAYNPEFRTRMLAGGLIRRTPFTVVDPQRYARILDTARAQGWVSSRDEFEVGMSSIAVPVLLGSGARRTAVAAISVVGSTSGILGARRALIATVSQRIAAKFSTQLARRQS